MRRYYYLFLLFCVWNGSSVYAQLSITATGVNFTQDFNSMGGSTGAIPGGFRAGNPTNASDDHNANGTTTNQATTTFSSTQTGGCYNMGAGDNTSDRALGFLNSSSFTSGKAVTLQITNNTGVPINSITLSWNYEKYRNGNREWIWTFFHGPGSLASIAATAGNQVYPTDGANGSTISPPLSVSKSVTLTGLNIAPGASYYFRWKLTGTGGSTNGQALAIDNFVINCTSNVSPCPPGTPSVSLGNDTSFCAGTPFSLLLDAGNAGATFDWNNGAAATQTFTATQPGTYIVKVTDGSGCIDYDTLVIASKPLPVIPLNNTATYCAGTPFSMTLDAGNPGAAYDWENGAASTQTYTVTTAGTYSVVVTGTNGCVNSDSIVITQSPLPVVNIGADTSYCAGSSFFRIYDAGNPGSTYSWNGGTFTGQTFIVNQADTYTVTVTTPALCSATDTVIVTEVPLPVVNLGQDTAYCAGTPFSWTLDAGNAGAAFDWNNGAGSVQTFVVSGPGNWFVTVTDSSNCVNSDSVVVTEHALPVVTLPADTAYCFGTPFSWTLDAGNPNATFDWNNGAGSAQTFVVSSGGNWFVTVTDSNSCVNSDSVFVTENLLPVVDLGNDTSYCAGVAFAWAINAGNPGATYSWNNGADSAAVFIATTAGTYSVVVTDVNGCVNADSVIVTENPLPVLDLGPDVVTPDQNAVLTAPAGFAAYNWSNGQNTQTISVTQTGTYTLTVTDANGCTDSDDIGVLITFSNEETELALDATVYPNPSNGYLHIRLNEALKGAADAALFNMAGQSVYNTRIQEGNPGAEVTLDLAHLAEGMYILRLNGDAKTRTFKIIIRK